MSDPPRAALADRARAGAAHLAWQRELGATVFPRAGAWPEGVVRPPVPSSELSGGVRPTRAASVPVSAPVPVPAPVPNALVAPALLSPRVLAPVASVPDAVVEAAENDPRRSALRVIQDEVRECTRCKLASGRTQTVFARGNPSARLCFVGEGPGEQEDRTGIPFVGPAGQLLDRIIVAMGLSPEEVYVVNIVKCRPPGNRSPDHDEMSACTPYLARQLALVRPEVIVALGRTAVSFLLDTRDSLGKLRGRWNTYEGIPVLPTWHPSYLLRYPENKPDTWADMKLVMARLGIALPQRSSS